MIEKIVNARFQNKTDTSTNWGKIPNFIPKYGEIICYSDLKKVKIGDGVTKISLLPFAYSDVMNKINEMKTVDVTADNPDDSVSIWIDPDEDGDIFTATQGTPLIATDKSKMTDVNKLYVLTTNQHIYYHNGTAWTDSGMAYTGATVVQETGTSTTDVMSQKVVTDELNGLKHDLLKEIKGETYTSKFTEKVMLYYGYPNAINNSWDVNNSANIYKDYDICIFGDGYCLPTHEAYAETVQIFNILRRIAPNTKIVGYVPIGMQEVGDDSGLPMSELKARVDAWVAIGVHGIFLDEFGFDYGVTRARQNEIVSYCHGLGLFVFANSWSTDYCFSDDDIVIDWLNNFHPNPNRIRSVLNENDYYVYEHLFYNSYTTDDGELHIECAETYRIDDIITYFTAPKIDGKSYREVFGSKVFSLDSIPTAASITQKNEMMSLSIIGSAILNIDAIAFGDEFWGSASNYHQWDFPQLDLKTEGINSISRDTRRYITEEGEESEFTYKWTASINGNSYSIVFDIDNPTDITYASGKRYAECNGVKVDNVWLTIYDFQTFLKDANKKMEETETLVTTIKNDVDNAMPTAIRAEEKVNTFMTESETKIEEFESRVNTAIADIAVVTSGFNYLETEW